MGKGLRALVGALAFSSAALTPLNSYPDDLKKEGVLETVWSMVVRSCNAPYSEKNPYTKPCDMVLTADVKGEELSLFANNYIVHKNTISSQGIVSAPAFEMKGLAVRVGFGGFCDYFSVNIVQDNQKFDDAKIPDVVQSLPNDSDERDCNKGLLNKKGDYDMKRVRAFHNLALETMNQLIEANKNRVKDLYHPKR